MNKSTVLGVLFALLVSTQAIHATPWKVGADGNTNGAALRAAIAEAESGDTIYIYPGTYHHIRIILSKSLFLIGVKGPEVTILDGRGEDFGLWISKPGSKSHIEGLTFLNCLAVKHGGAINLVTGGDLTIRNNIFKGCSGLIGGAIYSPPRSNPLIENCLFVDNRADLWGGAIYSQVGNAVIRNNTFIHNSAGEHGGSLGFHDAAPKISNNIFYNDPSPSTIFFKTAACKPEHHCNAYWNDSGELIAYGDPVKDKGDLSMFKGDPLFSDSEFYTLSDQSPYLNEGKCGKFGWR